MSRCALALCAFSACVATTLDAQTDLPTSPDWWRDSVCYEVFVRSFQDSDGDGVGDLAGLIARLDYINDGDASSRDDLGANCIWLMPVAQSPSYHGYDVTNYYQINRDYGTNADFERLMEEAHARGIRVLVDLVLNHTSSEHPYFRAALFDRESPYRDWYTWAPEPRPMPGWEAPTWHRTPAGNEYYYGLFWSGMPDLALANPDVRAEAERVARFWLEDMGVDGFRMDAVAHFFEDGGRWRHVEAVHPWLRDYAAAVRRIEPAAFTVGEVWDSTGAILPYYPDQLDAYFMFEVADAIFDAVRSGSRRTLTEAVQRVQRDVPAGRGAIFLRNHDQTRTMTELNGDAARASLAATLLLTLPGIPFVYYGEEIGMTGAKPSGDPRLRTPMPWTREPGVGFTTGVPWEPLHADSLTANVQAHDSDPASLLNHYRELIHLRTADATLSRGDVAPLETGSDGVLAYLRRTEGRAVLVVSNLTDRRAAGFTLSSASPVLEPGRWTVRPLFGGGADTDLRISRNGRVRGWTPIAALDAFESRILELTRTP